VSYSNQTILIAIISIIIISISAIISITYQYLFTVLLSIAYCYSLHSYQVLITIICAIYYQVLIINLSNSI